MLPGIPPLRELDIEPGLPLTLTGPEDRSLVRNGKRPVGLVTAVGLDGPPAVLVHEGSETP